jgi:hypothetical protein
MSLKNSYNKIKNQDVGLKNSTQKNISDFNEDLESEKYVSELTRKYDNHLLDVDFSNPSNFAKFGLARKYYENIVNRIVDYYPYDGSKYEQLKFENELNPLEKYVFNYEYPRSTGYVEFGRTWGSTSTISNGFGSSSLPEYIKFNNQTKNNIYDPVNSRRENTRFIFASGSTIEFWLKKNSFPNTTTETNKECIFYTRTVDSDKRVAIYVSGGSSNTSSIYTEYYTGTSTSAFSLSFDTGLATIADSKWHHYSFVYGTSSSGYSVDFYLDGAYKSTKSQAGTVIDITGSSVGFVGALGGKYNSASDLTGYGKLSGSVDEFRFWNSKRNAKQIGINYFKNIGGGSNTDLANVNLGIYYKFNEGIVGSSSIDSIILDHSGRLNNGNFVGYVATSRNTGSAITQGSENIEIGSPIVYLENPLVQSFLNTKLNLADSYDYQNNSNLINLLPAWIIEDDQNNGDTLANFLQVIASYYDTLFLQIQKVKDVKNKTYLQYSGSEAGFNDLLLSSHGFDVPSAFMNLDELLSVSSQDNKKEYSLVINDLKNIVYKNIYNNLDIIYKSKGTEKSFKNLIKCFGVDDDMYKLNIYSDGSTYQLKDSYVNKSIKKDVIDQTSYRYNQNSNSVIYNFASNDSNTTSFITSSNSVSGAICFEGGFYFPKKPDNLFEEVSTKSNLKTYSLFGIRQANNNTASTDYVSPDSASFSVYLNERDEKAYFSLVSNKYNVNLTSSFFDDFRENNSWNISFQIYQNKFLTTPEYEVKFSGYSFLSDNNFRSFELSSSFNQASGSSFFGCNKRLFVGAERTNITGTIIYGSSHKTAYTRVWMDKLDSEELKEHAKNPNNFGRKNPTRNNNSKLSGFLPKSETLILNWDYSTTTSSNSNGNVYYVQDLTSGSLDANFANSYLSGSKSRIYTGVGYGFEPSITIKSKELIYGQEQQDPENIISSNLVNILETNDDYYTKDARPEKFFFAVETSMYDVISKNILNFFGSIVEFNNLITTPTFEYSMKYKDIDYFRRIFFNKVQNNIDLEKYVNVYKWIDDALDGILFNLIPASANSADKARTIIENHVLSRNKVRKQIHPKSFIHYIKDSSGNVGDESLYVGPPTKNYGIIGKETTGKLGGTSLKKF